MPRGLVAVSLVAAAFVVVQLARMSVYMVDPAATSDELWLLPPSQPGAPRAVRRIKPFPDDSCEYTTTFLLLPRALLCRPDGRGARGLDGRDPRRARQSARRISSR